MDLFRKNKTKIIQFTGARCQKGNENVTRPKIVRRKFRILQIVRFLLRNGANVNDCNGFGMNYYLTAIGSGDLEQSRLQWDFVIKTLLTLKGMDHFTLFVC